MNETTGTEIVRREACGISGREPTALEVIAQAARDPAVDVAKLQALLAMKERLEDRDAEVAFNRDMVALQSRLPRIIKSRKIEVKGTLRSKYAAFEDIDIVVRPLMIEYGFAASYTTEDHGPKETKITCTIRHKQGHKENFSVIMPFDRSEYRSDPQSQGSTISIGKRYAFCLGLNITTVGEDNDGQGGCISDTQVDSIHDVLTECGAQRDPQVESAFLKYMGVKVVKEILARDYQKAMKALEAKRRAVIK